MRIQLTRKGAAVLLPFLSACAAVGPDYQAPPVAAPAKWSETAAALPVKADLARWWRGFGDERLDWLIERAVEGNLDLQVAAARVNAARAEQLSADAAFWPKLGASGGYQRMRISPNAIKGLFGTATSGQASAAQAATPFSNIGPIGDAFNLFQSGFDASWELDLFGGIQRRQEAADAEYAATVEQGRDLLLSLTAEVARTYFGLLARERHLETARERVRNQGEILRLAEHSYTEGLATALDARRARAELEASAAEPPALEAQIKQSRHALATLLGLAPTALEHRLAQVPADIPQPPSVPLGLPSDVLRRRPDIRKAERDAAAASASIGVATAELFPKLSLTGSVGLQSQELGNFTSLSSGFYGFGPRLSLPLFQGGRLRANLSAQEAAFEQSTRQYQKTVLNAFREVEDALAGIDGEAGRKASLAAAEASARRGTEAATALYTEGEADFSAVLDAHRSWYETRDRLTESQLSWATTHVALFKALGGGWAGASAPKPAQAAAGS